MMVSLKLSLSRATSQSSMLKDDWEELDRPPSSTSTAPRSVVSSSNSSLLSTGTGADAEDLTINVRNMLENGKGKQRSIDDLRLLAVSTNMTELSYSISDIQTRIFEIQELRHQSQSSDHPQTSSTNIIDQALMNLDERLEAVNRGMKSVADALEPLSSQTPKQPLDEEDEGSLLLRKHSALMSDWEAIQDESDVLREELKEDKWLTVFRTVSEQADGMMTSLEKAVQRCQDFIWRVHRRAPLEDTNLYHSPPSSSRDAVSGPPTYEIFCGLQESFEAKKKHYMPATSKVLSIIDKGVQDRVTKNGECLRRHAESIQRWRNLWERIQRTDVEMETVCKILLMRENEASESGSVASGNTSKSSSAQRSKYLATPPSSEGSRRLGNPIDSITNSMSPFRKLARRIGKVGGRSTPTAKQVTKTPSSEPVPGVRHRGSMFPLRGVTNLTPDRPMHKHSQSYTPESPTMRRAVDPDETVKGRRPMWNSSTKVEPETSIRLVRPTLSRRTSAANMRTSTSGGPPVPPLPPRSQSRSSFASSRPWSPITASGASTTRSSVSRPPSRSQSPFGFSTSPRARPKTPSHIPTPVFWKGTSSSSETSYEDRSPPESSIMQRLSPSQSDFSTSGISYSRAKTPLGSSPYGRPPSRSMIPVPKFQISSASRPSSAMSDYERSETSMSFRSSAYRAQTPESTLRGRVKQLPYYHDTPPPSAAGRRSSRMPPSSFRDASATPSQPRTPSSRPGSRTGMVTPGMDIRAMHTYVPVNSRDPLDAEVAVVANGISHGLLIERVDPPLRVIPKENEEVKAQYAFSNHLARKVVACRLLTMSRSGVKSKKVMCRVGGGWQELQLYLLTRQAGV
ncbi:hypothetical protein EW145_g3407 [Phellinidium pouzarii]|uniref:GAR domain-containing protein n=1 Tax=Phellinidium pouzarii TaxID=167371 RepID=A0A4S4L7H0_9AGAM|nr:hypothetical protein EW145_g3407 [Phellinidium pouzarii]